MSANEATASLTRAPVGSRARLSREADERGHHVHPCSGLRRARRLIPAILAASLLIASPWVGWWAPLPFLATLALLAAVHGRFGTSPAIARTLIAAWVVVGITIAIGVTLAGQSAAHMLILTAPVAAVIVGATLATGLADPVQESRGEPPIDPPTGLLDRESLNRRVSEIEAQSELAREPTGVALLGLTGASTPTDALTTEQLDRFLAEAVHRLHQRIGAYAPVFRIADDELLVLVPGGDLDRTLRVGEEARSALTSDSASSPRVVASCGVSASWPGEPFDFARILTCAARALQRAKRIGRVASEEPGSIESFGALT